MKLSDMRIRDLPRVNIVPEAKELRLLFVPDKETSTIDNSRCVTIAFAVGATPKQMVNGLRYLARFINKELQ